MSILKKTYTFLTGITVLSAASLMSCDRLHEDLDPCPQGVRLRFVYDYNMEYANAFPSQVDCLTLLVYDRDGHWLRTETAGRPETADEEWRMTIDLPAGDYRMLAYGGMDCSEASFRFATPPAETSMEDLQVYLPDALITSPEGTDLHNLFYGALDITVPEAAPDTDYTEGLVRMMRDTNDILVLLANENGDPVDADDFVFTITDNNTDFNYLNDIISHRDVTYSPWACGESQTGLVSGGKPALVGWAEFSVPRLMERSGATLTVTRRSDGERTLSIPIVEMLLALKGERYRKMADQEFLDRENRWRLAFILNENGVWGEVEIIINDWVVRLNNVTQ